MKKILINLLTGFLTILGPYLLGMWLKTKYINQKYIVLVGLILIGIFFCYVIGEIILLILGVE